MKHVRIDEKFLLEAAKYSDRCTFKRFKTGCVVVKDRKVVSAGWSHFSEIRRNDLFSVHSEIHSLGRARHLDLTGAVAYISNISRKSGNIALAKPCVSCAVALYSSGIRYAVYSIDKANHGVLDLSEDLSELKVYSSDRREETDQ